MLLNVLIIFAYLLVGQFLYWLMWFGDSIIDRECRPIRVSSVVFSLLFMFVPPITVILNLVVWSCCFIDNRFSNPVVFDVCKWWEERKNKT